MTEEHDERHSCAAAAQIFADMVSSFVPEGFSRVAAPTWEGRATQSKDRVKLMNHVAIVGSRSRTDPETVERLVAKLPAGTVIVSGGASGPDTWAEEAARKYGFPVKIFRPDLEGARSQGQVTRRHHNRNQRIVDIADELIALVAPDRRGGTEDTIRRAERKGIPITIL